MNIERVAKYTTVPTYARRMLEKPEKQVTLNMSVRASNSNVVQADAYMVFFSTVRGPAKGGIRFNPHVTLEETTKLAELMVWKTALVGIPFGGGKSGVAIDASGLDFAEKTAIVKEFVHLIRNELNSGEYVPAPDMGTGASDMATIFGETHKLESVTGKPPRVGGLPGREEATGRGVSTVTQIIAKRLLPNPNSGPVTVAVQGFGNVGSWAARFLHESGYRIVAASDINGGIYDPDGLDVIELFEHIRSGGTIEAFNAGEDITNESLLELPVDILIPAAIGGVITGDNAERIQAPIVIEAANHPTLPEADDILDERSIVVVPDILANAGGVIGSYVEWRSARSGSLTKRDETFQVIDSILTDATSRVFAVTDDLDIPPRVAAEIHAVDEVVATMDDRGWI